MNGWNLLQNKQASTTQPHGWWSKLLWLARWLDHRAILGGVSNVLPLMYCIDSDCATAKCDPYVLHRVYRNRNAFTFYILLNPLCAKFFRWNKKIYLHFMSFLHVDMPQSWNPLSCKTKTYLFYIVNIMGADVLATQGARASATMILTWLNRDISFPAH